MRTRRWMLAGAVTAILSLTLAGCKTAARPDDRSLTTAVQTKLTADAAIAAEPIQSYVQSGVAILQGTVSSEAAKSLAASDAAQVAGVRSVVNQLTVQQASTRPAPAAPAAPPPISEPQPSARTRPQASREREPRVARSQAPAPAPVERRDAHRDEAVNTPPAPVPVPQAAAPVPQAPPPPQFRRVTVVAGTTLPVQITQTLDSATTQAGDTFAGTIASDVNVDGVTAIPAGTPVSGRVEDVHEAAHFKGSALLTISLASINVHGDRKTVSTEPYTKEGAGRGKNTAEKVGGGAAVGAILGGILGGGKGAAIGAASGGGLGAGVNGVTRGQQVQIPSESLVRFKLAGPIEVKAPLGASADSEGGLQRHTGN